MGKNRMIMGNCIKPVLGFHSIIYILISIKRHRL